MQISKTKKGFILKDCGLTINFNSYEYDEHIKKVSLYRDGVLVAIYENVEKFEKQLKRC